MEILIKKTSENPEGVINLDTLLLPIISDITKGFNDKLKELETNYKNKLDELLIKIEVFKENEEIINNKLIESNKKYTDELNNKLSNLELLNKSNNKTEEFNIKLNEVKKEYDNKLNEILSKIEVLNKLDRKELDKLLAINGYWNIRTPLDLSSSTNVIKDKRAGIAFYDTINDKWLLYKRNKIIEL